MAAANVDYNIQNQAEIHYTVASEISFTYMKGQAPCYQTFGFVLKSPHVASSRDEFRFTEQDRKTIKYN